MSKKAKIYAALGAVALSSLLAVNVSASAAETSAPSNNTTGLSTASETILDEETAVKNINK